MSEDSGEKVPLWYVSFADMITLLLSFFVMLQTMAKTQDAKLLGISQESFRRAIAGMGIPDFLFGNKGQLDMQYRKLKYSTEEQSSDLPRPLRVIDADDDMIRHLFEQIRKEAQGPTSSQQGKWTNLHPLAVKFAQGSSALGEEGKAQLEAVARDLLRSGGGRQRLTVLAMAPDEPTPKEQWTVSGLRAQEAARCLSEALARGGQSGWQVLPSGVGPGNEKLEAMGFTPGKLTILVAVMAAGG